MKTLLIINFETGDASVPYYDVPVVINAKNFDYKTFEDSFASYLDSNMPDDKDYEDMVEEVLNESGYEWSFVSNKIPECNNYKLMYI